MDRINKISGLGDEFTACLCSNEALVALYERLCKCQCRGIFTLRFEALTWMFLARDFTECTKIISQRFWLGVVDV